MDSKVAAVLDTYHELIREEQRQRRERPTQDDRNHRFLAVGPKTGQLINILAGSLREPVILEIGTSFGYSGIWLAEAARSAGGRLVTMEACAHKSVYAREMSEKAGLAEHVDFRVGDAVEMIADLETGVDFVLLDLWKHLYLPCLNAFLPKLNPGAIIVADNISANRTDNRDYVEKIRSLPDIASFPVPVGSGLEISRFMP